MSHHSGSGGGSGGGGGGSSVTVISVTGKTSVNLARIDYAGTNVTTSAYVTLIASTSDTINELFIFNGNAATLFLAFGAAASEVNKMYIPPGGFGFAADLLVPAGTRLSVKAVDADATTGSLVVTGFK